MARPPLYARQPTDPAEERTLRRLASARHAPASLIQRARIVTASWDGASVPELAQRLGCHPKTVYKWLHRFNADGPDGLADLPRPGLPRRISEHERGRIIQLARTEPPGRLHQGGEGLLALTSRRRRRTGPWTPWRVPPRPRAFGSAAARSAASSSANGCAGGARGPGRPAPTRTSSPKGAGHRLLHRPASGDVGDRCRRARPGDPPQLPARPWLDPDGHRVKAVLDYSRGPEKTWVDGALRVADGQAITLTAPSRNSIGYQQLLAAVEAANPAGTIVVVTDNVSSHTSASTRTWLLDHPRIQHTFIPKAPAGSTSRRAGGGCFAARRWPGSASPPLRRSPGHQGGDLSAQRPRPSLGVGPPATVPTPPTPHLYLPNVRNIALGDLGLRFVVEVL